LLRVPVNISIIEMPFERIAMVIVGPLPKSARGHQYIPVNLDYATRYPEGNPLQTISSKIIAKELVPLFTRVGIPKEILTDQETPFIIPPYGRPLQVVAGETVEDIGLLSSDGWAG
jgi:hypothetical protein